MKKANKKAKDEHIRCYKYEREVLNIKENYYNKLLNKYADCSNINLRHTRHTKLIKTLYKKEEEFKLGLKDDIDEFVKYLKCREEKIGYLEKRLKKKEKEVEEEQEANIGYLNEIEATA